MVVLQLFNRERKAYKRFEEINRNHMDAYKDAILAYSVYYPVIEILSAIAIACVIWFGGGDVLRNLRATSVAISFNWKTLVAFRLVRNRSVTGCAGSFHSVRSAIFSADHGLQRKIQHPAVSHGSK